MAARFDINDPNALAQLIELTIGYGVGGAASRLADPFVQPAANIAWTNVALAGTGVPVDVQTMALLARMGITPNADALDEAHNTGFDDGRFTRYVQATRTPPPFAEALELYRRGRYDLAKLRTVLLHGGADERYVDDLITLFKQELSVADLAMARQQEFIGDDELHRRSALVGYSADDADLFFKMAGLPPGITVGLELLRRGEIDEARFAEYVAEGHTKTKYTQDLLDLRYTPLSAAVAAELLIRERISREEAVAIGEKNGLREQDFIAWSNGLGRPPGIVEALTVINRGVHGDPNGPAAHAFFREVVARSDVRTEYANDLYELRTHYPPLFQVERALVAGTIDTAVAADTLHKEGYPKEWVDAIVNAHSNGATAKAKDLAASTIEALYEAGLDTHEEAAKALQALHYSEAQSEQLLKLWLARRIVGELIRATSIIRGRYVAWKIDKPTAVADLDQVLNDAATRDRLFQLWDLEHEANAPVLTPSQIGQGFKYGRFTLDEALAAWQGRGYTLDDATTLAWIEAKGNPFPAAPAAPPPAPGA